MISDLRSGQDTPIKAIPSSTMDLLSNIRTYKQHIRLSSRQVSRAIVTWKVLLQKFQKAFKARPRA
jgi:hypothetical protein